MQSSGRDSHVQDRRAGRRGGGLPAAAPSIRVGAHKDAEIRLIGAHTLGATIEQELGAVFITRRSDNVAVDLLGLSPKERARLRDGAEIQIGQLYTLTVTSAARAGG